MPIRKLPCPTGGKPGENLDKVAEYQEKRAVANAFGGVTESDSNWRKVASAYCSIQTGSGTEVWRARQADSDTDAVVKMTWSPAREEFSASGRFLIKGKTYQILAAVNENEDDQMLIFSCRRTV